MIEIQSAAEALLVVDGHGGHLRGEGEKAAKCFSSASTALNTGCDIQPSGMHHTGNADTTQEVPEVRREWEVAVVDNGNGEKLQFSSFFLRFSASLWCCCWTEVDESADQMQDPVNTEEGPWWLGRVEGWKGMDGWMDGQLGRSEQAMERGDRRSYVLLGGQMWRGRIQGRGWTKTRRSRGGGDERHKDKERERVV